MPVSMGRQTRNSARPTRFVRLSVRESRAADMLYNCPVVTAEGEIIGEVSQLLVDVRTRQLRYVILSRGDNGGAEIVLPWKSLYFDSATARLVFHSLA
ncbi:MAG TPA: PRC-barrel domain-containing protein [Noviherbaspirillum sp.]|uniref:PRC-barrel domain-containing protein n=1 Tax=Noviherbaspirillum sp. TaxID=1926288 RepID=UPI002DDCA159|nr:PRC-barrel domain-containing protein [Noviherbaspirillum sp.]HEV2609395.1 PRC-barrel domain-containing protein [Noviherbaspirillum sp.]